MYDISVLSSDVYSFTKAVSDDELGTLDALHCTIRWITQYFGSHNLIFNKSAQGYVIAFRNLVYFETFKNLIVV